jgi:hypothetical protein
MERGGRGRASTILFAFFLKQKLDGVREILFIQN